MFNCSIAKHSHSLFSFISFRVFVSTELKLYADTLIKAYILYNHTTNRAIIKTRNMNISIQAKRYSWLFVGIYNVVIPYSFNCIEALKFAHALSVSTFLILWICIGWAKCVKTLITVPWFMLVLIVFFFQYVRFYSICWPFWNICLQHFNLIFFRNSMNSID